METTQPSKRGLQWLRAFNNEKTIHFSLWVLYFFGTAFSERNPGLTLDQIVFALNYMGMVFLVNYVYLPGFLYQNKRALFVVATLVTLTASMLLEELVLESIFFPHSRGSYFNPYYGIIEIGTILIFFLGFRLLWDHQKNLQQIDQLQSEKLESQLNFLKSQINPHFLFNNLNNLYSYALRGSSETPRMILQLSEILRYVLYESQGSFVSLTKELQQVENFIELQRLQLEGRGNINLTIKGSPEGYRIAPLMLFSFIENCFKHSNNTVSEGIVIQIHISVEQGKLHFECSNPYNREYMTSDSPAPGIGLKNVKERLTILYPGKHELNIEDAEETYTVRLELDLV